MKWLANFWDLGSVYRVRSGSKYQDLITKKKPNGYGSASLLCPDGMQIVEKLSPYKKNNAGHRSTHNVKVITFQVPHNAEPLTIYPPEKNPRSLQTL
jgi:hypothetical protein